MNQKISTRLGVVIIIIIAITAGVFVWKVNKIDQFSNQPAQQILEKKLTNESRLDFDKDVFPNIGDTDIPVIIFTEKIKEEVSKIDNRMYKTELLWKRIGNNLPEKLGIFGKIGEAVSEFVPSYDNKFIAINLGTKLQLLNVDTGIIDDVFYGETGFLSFTFSQDSRKLLILDKNPYKCDVSGCADSVHYKMYIVDIDSKKSELVKEGDFNKESGLYPTLWRDDDKVIFGEAMGDFSMLWIYDLEENKFISKNIALGTLSSDGRIMAGNNSFTTDDCNFYSGSATDTYEIIDLISGKKMGIVGKRGSIVHIAGFSRDNKNVIYSTEAAPLNENDCDKISTPIYYISENSGENVREISMNEAQELLNTWGEYSFADYDGINRIVYNSKTIASSQNKLYIVTQYYIKK